MSPFQSAYCHSRSVARFSATAAILLLLVSTTFAQEKNPQRGFQPGNAYSLSDIETINTTNGNLMLNFVLGKTAPGRGGLSGSAFLRYNAKGYDSDVADLVDSSGQISSQNYITPNEREGGWHLSSSLDYSLDIVNRNNVGGGPFQCTANGGYDDYHAIYLWKLRVIYPDGGAHEFRPTGYNDILADGYFNVDPSSGGVNSCNGITGYAPNPMTYFSADGTYTRLVINRGVGWTLSFPDGSRFENGTLYDRNGNYLTYGSVTLPNGHVAGGIVDRFGRYVVTDHNASTNEDYIYSLGFNNQTLMCAVKWKSIYVLKPYKTTLATDGRYRGNTSNQTYQGSAQVVDRVTLPSQLGNLSYQFSYNAVDYNPNDPPPTTESTGWGEVSGITLPSGAQVSYQYYQDGTHPVRPTTRNVLDNYITHKCVSYQAEYDGNSTPVTDNWTYACDHSGSSIIGPDGGVITHSFYDTSIPNPTAGLVYRESYPNGEVIERNWQPNSPPPATGVYGTSGVNYYVKTEFRSIPNAAGTLVWTAIKDYSYDKNGNVTKEVDYDFVPYNTAHPGGGAATLPGGLTPSRVTVTSYNNPTPDATNSSSDSSNAYWYPSAPALRNAPAATEIQDGNGLKFARAEFTYDNASATGNLIQKTSWDSTKGGYSNPLCTDSNLCTANSISVTNQYDHWSSGEAGKLIQTTDARGTNTVLTYGSVGGFDIYPTQIQTAYGTAVQRTEQRQYDFSSGLVTRVTDADNNVSSSTTYDVVGRLTLVKAADGIQGVETDTVTTYYDVDRRVVIKSDLNATGDGKLVSIQHFDQLGRLRLSRQLEDSATQDPLNESQGIKVQTRYLFSSSNSYAVTSNPYRAATSGAASGEQSMGWTRSKNDIGGRVIELQTFAGAGLPAPWATNTSSTGTVTTAYDANRTTVTDQANKLRRSVVNGLGQLIEVDEPDKDTGALDNGGTVIQPTNYTYDTLGNLKRVDQGGQHRYFLYDSLSRLIRARNPEQLVNSANALNDPAPDPNYPNSQWCFQYNYDNNGNLTTKIDPRNITSTYGYDYLNRNVSVTYSDGTPAITRVYDNSANGANGKGRLWKTQTNGNTGLLTTIDGYDALGRPLSQRQQFYSVSAWSQSYSVGRTYDRASHVLTQTYPSGHLVVYNHDAAGRLGDKDSNNLAFTGNLGDGVQRAYDSISGANAYDAASRMQEEKYGTLTPLYHKQHFNVRGQLYDIRLSTTPWATDQWNWNRGAITNSYDSRMTHQDPNSGPDNNGNLLRSEMWVPNDDQISGYNWTQQQYFYDSLNRLTSAAELQNGSAYTSVQKYQYDRWGNRTLDPTTWGYQINAVQTVADTNTNRMYAPNDTNHTLIDYDAAGNQTKDYLTWNGLRTYDAENRMISANNGTADSYTYDSDGHRVRRNIAGAEWWQVYGMDGELLAEYGANAAVFVPHEEFGYRNGQLLVTAANGDEARLTNFIYNFYFRFAVGFTSSDIQTRVNALAAAGNQGGSSQLFTEAQNQAQAIVSQSNIASDTDYVTALYLTYCQRYPDSGGLGYWVSQIPYIGRTGVRNAFAAAGGEFSARVNNLWGTAGSDNERTDAFVQYMYQAILHRWASSSEDTSAISNFDNAGATGQANVVTTAGNWARGLFNSTEYTSRSGLTPHDFVYDLYQAFLQRAPDQAGWDFWTGQVGTSWQNKQAVMDAFINAGPYGQRAGALYREVLWLTQDHLGTPRMIAERTGALAGIKRHDYLPFGEELFAGQGGRTPQQGYGANDTVRQKFTQKERDNETGLDYFLARYYSSTQGRFTSPDEFTGGPDELYTFAEDASNNPTFYANLGNPQSLNKYQYAYNNPLRYVDPDGHDPLDPPQDPACPCKAGPTDQQIIAAAKSVIETAAKYTGMAALADALRSGVPKLLKGMAETAQKTGEDPEGTSIRQLGDWATRKNQQGQGQSNTASPNPNDNDKKPFGSGGTQTTSTTVYNGKRGRIDVENPNPGQRAGQIHYQSGKTKLLYDPNSKSFIGASKSQNKQLMNDPQIQKAIKKGLKILGESQ
jgi:RHS repeat-associated protein